MQKAGFELIVTEDPAKRPDPLPWWYHISGDVKHAQGLQDGTLVVRNTKYGRWAVRLVRTLEFVRFAPKGTAKITEELVLAEDGPILGGRKGIFTPMYLMVGRNPEMLNVSTTENIVKTSLHMVSTKVREQERNRIEGG